MKWWFIERSDIGTALSVGEIMNKVRSIARERHGVIDTLNPDHQFNDDYKQYVGTINPAGFRVKKSYYTLTGRGTSQTMGLIVIGNVEDNFNQRTVHLKFTVPATNLLWFLFPPFYMMLGMAYAGDYGLFHGIPIFTILFFGLMFYLYWVVLAQFRRKAANALDDFEAAINGGGDSAFKVFTRLV